MSGITKKRFNDIQSEAMKLVSDIGITKLDHIVPLAARKAQIVVLCRQLETQEHISYEAARRHIAKAMRRQRHPNFPTGGYNDEQGV